MHLETEPFVRDLKVQSALLESARARGGGQAGGTPADADDRDDAQHRGRDHDEALQHDQFRGGDRDEDPRGGDNQEDRATPVHSASGTPKFFEAYKVQRITSMHALDNGDLASVLERVEATVDHMVTTSF